MKISISWEAYSFIAENEEDKELLKKMFEWEVIEYYDCGEKILSEDGGKLTIIR